ncbi:MAG: tetratricopeptide repeat protein [Candidatus Kapaibacterium sp.]
MNNYILDRIISDIENKNYESAISDCSELIEQFPDNIKLYEIRSVCYYAIGDFDSAIDDLSVIIPKLSDSQDDDNYLMSLYNWRGRNYMKKKEWGSAVDDFIKAININDSIPEVHNNLAVCYRRIDNFEDAFIHATKAIEFKHNFPEAFNNRANINVCLQNYEDAISDYSESINLNPGNPKTYYNRGSIYYEIFNDLGKAKGDFLDSVKLNPDYEQDICKEYPELKVMLFENAENGTIEYNNDIQNFDEPDEIKVERYTGNEEKNQNEIEDFISKFDESKKSTKDSTPETKPEYEENEEKNQNEIEDLISKFDDSKKSTEDSTTETKPEYEENEEKNQNEIEDFISKFDESKKSTGDSTPETKPEYEENEEKNQKEIEDLISKFDDSKKSTENPTPETKPEYKENEEKNQNEIEDLISKFDESKKSTGDSTPETKPEYEENEEKNQKEIEDLISKFDDSKKSTENSTSETKPADEEIVVPEFNFKSIFSGQEQTDYSQLTEEQSRAEFQPIISDDVKNLHDEILSDSGIKTSELDIVPETKELDIPVPNVPTSRKSVSEKKSFFTSPLFFILVIVLIAAVILLTVFKFQYTDEKQPIVTNTNQEEPKQEPKEEVIEDTKEAPKTTEQKQPVLESRNLGFIGSKQSLVLFSEPDGYYVQIGSFKEKAKAEEKMKLLKKYNIKGAIIEADLKEKGVYYRVRAGAFKSEEEAKQLTTKLE